MTDAVDWSTLDGAYGTVDMSSKLRGVDEGDPSALQEIMENIEHQGTLYPLTTTVVPFLINILAGETQADKAPILDQLHFLIKTLDDTIRYEVASLRGDYVENLIRLQRAFESGALVYLQLLHHADKRVRQRAVVFVTLFAQPARARTALQEHFAIETDVTTKAVLLCFWGKLPPSDEAIGDQKANATAQDQFITLAKTELSPFVRQAAAIAWVTHQLSATFGRYTDLPPVVEQILFDVIFDSYSVLGIDNLPQTTPASEPSEAEMSALPEYIKREFKAEVVFHLLTVFGNRVKERLLTSPRLTPYIAHLVCREILDQVFQRVHYAVERTGKTSDENAMRERWQRYIPVLQRNQTQPQQLIYQSNDATSQKEPNPVRYNALEMIVNCDAFWKLPTNLFSFFYDLPDDREALRTLMEQYKPS